MTCRSRSGSTSPAEHSLRVAQLPRSSPRSKEPSQTGRRCSPSGTTHRKPAPATSRTDQHSPEVITADQTDALPDTARKTVQEAVAEYEAAQTPEAHCAKDADKLECLIPAIEYQDAGR